VRRTYISTLFAALALEGGGWPVPRPGHFTLFSLHFTGGLLSLVVDLDGHEKYHLHWDSIPDSPTRLDHIDVQHLVGLVWTSDELVAETEVAMASMNI